MKKKVLLTSIATIALCLCLIAGSTFALFTSESKVNVAVTSGKVSVVATVGALKLSSMDIVQTAVDANGKQLFANGGTAVYDETTGEITLDRVTPGDKVEFDITATNSSDITIQYRITWKVEGELAEALKATVDGAPIVNNTTDWAEWTPTEAQTKVFSVAVELPAEVGNEYQEKTADISFNVEAVQANGTELYGKTVVSDVDGLKAAAANTADTNVIALAAPLTITDDVTLDFNGKTVEGNFVLEDNAKLDISNCDLVNDNNTVSAIQIDGDNVEVVLDDVNIASARHGIRVEGEGAKVTINDGTYSVAPTSNMTMHALNIGGDGIDCEVTINGGTFIGPKGTIADSGSAVCVQSGTLTINGGNFSGGKLSTLSAKPGATIIVKGGTFDQDPSAYVAAGLGAIALDGSYVIGTKVDSTSIKTAISAGKNVILTNDIALTSNLMNTKDVVIDLNGKTITTTASTSLFQSQSNAAPSMIITSSTAGAVIDATGSTFSSGVVHSYGKTEIRNVTINAGTNKVVQVQGKGSVEIYDTVINAVSGNTFNVAGDFTLGEGTVVNVTNLNSSFINNNGKHTIVIDGAKINVGTFRVNGGAMISLAGGTTLTLNDTEITVGLDTTYTSYFISKAENATIEGCTLDVTDANDASYDIEFKPDANVGAKYVWVKK